jgi:hypothetical protein
VAERNVRKQRHWSRISLKKKPNNPNNPSNNNPNNHKNPNNPYGGGEGNNGTDAIILIVRGFHYLNSHGYLDACVMIKLFGLFGWVILIIWVDYLDCLGYLGGLLGLFGWIVSVIWVEC